ncbi:hypothetical protein ACOSP7_009518 [Xanthoceras sorbifolium]
MRDKKTSLIMIKRKHTKRTPALPHSDLRRKYYRIPMGAKRTEQRRLIKLEFSHTIELDYYEILSSALDLLWMFPRERLC